VEEVNARGWNEEGIYRVPGYSVTCHCSLVMLQLLNSFLTRSQTEFKFPFIPFVIVRLIHGKLSDSGAPVVLAVTSPF